jgi:hypothetical protein
MIMKTTTTLLLSAFAITVAAQTVQPEPYLMVDPISAEQQQQQQQQQPAKRDFPAEIVIWAETFDSTVWHTALDYGVPIPENMPAGWSVVDNTGNNFFWRWSTTGPRGRYTSVNGAAYRIKSTSDRLSGVRGFVMLESDHYNTTSEGAMVNPPVVMDSYIQHGPIEILGFEAISIYFEQYHRFCCASYSATAGPKLLVSSDGENWVEFPVHKANINSTPVSNPAITELSLTSVLGGQSVAYLRFHHKGQSHYFWEIDDIYLFRPFDHDARILNYWVDYAENIRIPYVNASGQYNEAVDKRFSGIPYMVPYFAFQELVSSRARIENFGAQPLTNVAISTKLFKNSTELHSFTSPEIDTVFPAIWDTLEISHSLTLSLNLDNIGNYHMAGIVSASEEDVNHINNNYRYDFRITKNVYSFANPEFVNTDRASPASYTGPLPDLGIVVMLNPSDSINPVNNQPYPHIVQGVNVFVNNETNNQQYWQQGRVQQFHAIVYEIITYQSGYTGIDIDNPICISDPIAIDSTKANSWVFLPINNGTWNLSTLQNPVQKYFVSLRMVDDYYRFYIGADKITQPSQYSYLLNFWGDIGYTANLCNPAIQLIVSHFGTDPNTPTHFTIRNHANGNIFPAAGASVRIQNQTHTADSEGNLTLDLVGGTHTYWVDYGDETRKGHVTVYGLEQTVAVNFGTVGMKKPTLLNEIKLYPNPAQNLLTVESTTEPQKIEITNLLGQTLKTMVNPTARQTVDISGLATGVYVVTVVDRGNGRVSKMFVKQ